MKEQIIQLEAHDDVTSVRDKLGWARAPRVLLVFPPEPILQRRLDLLLLQREATRQRAQLALITRDPLIKEQASDLGIACFRDIEASRKRYWRTERAKLDVRRSEQPVPLSSELVEAGTRLSQNRVSNLPENLRRVITASALLTGMLATCAGVVFFIPGATVILHPASNPVTVTARVTALPDAPVVDTQNGIIPARVVGIEVEGFESISTTGIKQIPSEKSTGTVLLTNLIPDQVTVPGGTIVRTSAAQPVRFITLVDVTLPAQIGETVEVPIEALEAGFVGNLPGNRINQIEGPLATRVGVTNPDPTRGGDAAETLAIAEEDLERVQAVLLQQLQQRAYTQMQTDNEINLLDAEFIPVESLTVVFINSETYDGFPGQVADRIGLTMRITVQGLAIDERLAKQIVYARLAEKVGPGYTIEQETLDFRRAEVLDNQDGTSIIFIMQGAGEVSIAINDEVIQKNLRGKSVEGAKAQLDHTLPLLQPTDITLTPRFWPLMPLMPSRISVQVDGQS